MTAPTPHQRLTRAGLSAQFADLVLSEHAHQLAETIRASRDNTRGATQATKVMDYAADLIDSKAQR